MISKIPTPESFFGFVPGTDRKMIRWDRLCEYYDTLNSLSDRMVIEEAGLSSEGNRFIFIRQMMTFYLLGNFLPHRI